MSKFELYHPILTPHYQLNWLTHFKAKDVNDLRQKINPHETMIETANYINREMSTVMNDKALTWGISDKQTDQFMGIVKLAPLTDHFKETLLTITNVSEDNTMLVSEIRTYMTEFSKNELHSEQLKIELK